MGFPQARVLKWVAISFSRGSSQPRDRSQVSRIAGRRFNLWAIREAPLERKARIHISDTRQAIWSLTCVSPKWRVLRSTAAAAAKSHQSCPLWFCETPETAAHQAPLSPGFSMQEYWSGLPVFFHALEGSSSNAWKWKVKVKLLSLSDSERPHGPQPTRLLHPWDFPGKSTGVGCHCLLPHSTEEEANTKSSDQRTFIKGLLPNKFILEEFTYKTQFWNVFDLIAWNHSMHVCS